MQKRAEILICEVKMVDFDSVIDTAALFEACFSSVRAGAEVFFIGKTVLGVPIPCISVGGGEGCSLFVGAHHGSEHITANILLKYALECSPQNRVYVVPMLNVDGCAVSQGALGAAATMRPFFEKLSRGDVVHWQANARGVDLNHNYNAGFDKCKAAERALGITSPSPTRYGGEYPESEPETAALCALVRHLSPRLHNVVALHTQGEEIYFEYDGKCPDGARELAKEFSLASGYALSRPENAAGHGGFKDWVIDKFGIPAFTVECGAGKNPLPPSDFSSIYEKVRPILDIAAAF